MLHAFYLSSTLYANADVVVENASWANREREPPFEMRN